MNRWPDNYQDPAGEKFPEASWDPKFKEKIPEAEKHLERLWAIHLPEPPEVPITRGELDVILNNPNLSDFQQRLPDIQAEDTAPPAGLFDPLDAGVNGKRPRTRALLTQAVRWSLPYIMYFKARWMRARPNHLEPQIQPVLTVPGHPAYPSGHSTQGHLMALVGWEVSRNDSIGMVLWTAADRIAQNREYAGLHYRTDSACGVELARQLLPFFLEDYGAAVAAAREAEWPQA